MPPTLAPGAMIAQRYRLTRLLGEGGMGMVWAATHTVTRRHVAIKFPRQSVGPEIRRRFLREAIAISSVNHPNVVRVHDAFELEDGTPIMVMDLLRGETFRRLLERRLTLSLSETARIILPVVSAVGTAHAFGIIHRDLKPDNVFLAKVGGETTVKVLDFGIAKLDPIGSGTFTVTTTGSTLGTPCYMAPEQSLGEKDIDHRADLWALGVMLYEALSGGRPIDGENIGQVVRRMFSEAITPIAACVPGLPSDVTSLIDRMLTRERTARLSDLREAMDVLSQHVDLRLPAFGPPRSQVVEDEPPEPSEIDVPSYRAAGPLTTNAPETLHSLPRAESKRFGLRAVAIAGTVALAGVGLFIAWPKDHRGAEKERFVSTSPSVEAPELPGPDGGLKTATPLSGSESSVPSVASAWAAKQGGSARPAGPRVAAQNAPWPPRRPSTPGVVGSSAAIAPARSSQPHGGAFDDRK